VGTDKQWEKGRWGYKNRSKRVAVGSGSRGGGGAGGAGGRRTPPYSSVIALPRSFPG
jgi:hypothetical protein